MRAEFTWLYIEDNEADAQLVRIILQEHRPDVRLIVAADGDQAISILEDTRSGDIPDVVLTDLTFPRFEGTDLIRRIRQFQKCRAIPLVAFTARQSEAVIQQCLDSGATAYIAKNSDLDGMTSDICGIANRYCVAVAPGQNDSAYKTA
jgi:CheY-like chemotaxis protein